MATLAKNSVFENFRGKFGNQFVIRQSKGKTILSSLPGRSSKSSTAKQEAGRIDDIQVKRVIVSLRDAENNELEFGDCELDDYGSAWNYYIKADHTLVGGQHLRVVAYDIPGNVGEMKVTL